MASKEALNVTGEKSDYNATFKKHSPFLKAHTFLHIGGWHDISLNLQKDVNSEEQVSHLKQYLLHNRFWKMAVEWIKIWYTLSSGSLDNSFCRLFLKLSTVDMYCFSRKYTKNKFN